MPVSVVDSLVKLNLQNVAVLSILKGKKGRKIYAELTHAMLTLL